MAVKNCVVTEIPVHVYQKTTDYQFGCDTPASCNPDCDISGMFSSTQVRLVGPECVDITLKELSIIHAYDLVNQIVVGQEITFTLERTLDCGGCCDPLLYTVGMGAYCPGQALPPGRYKICIPDQPAKLMGEASSMVFPIDTVLELIVEPLSTAQLQAAAYNSQISC